MLMLYRRNFYIVDIRKTCK